MMPYWTQAIVACKCGHPAHEGRRCQPLPFGCPCAEHEAAEPKTMNADEALDYYYAPVRR